jgi:hypothetical protein
VTRALLTAANRAFFPGAKAMLTGAARHHPDIPRWCLVPAEELGEARALFGHLARVETAPRPVAGIPDAMQICVAKLFAPMLPAEVVAYIDADAILCRSAPELWNVPVGQWNAIEDKSQNVLATVPRSMRPEFSAQFPDLLMKKAFNGGVWALRTAEWRDLPERYERALVAGAYHTYHPVFDQPMLNALIQPCVHWLPFTFNVNNLFDHTIPRDARIVHYTGGQAKPWDSRYPRHEPQYYWWLRHGLNEARPAKLFAAKLLILALTPKRVLSNALRQHRERLQPKEF